MSVRVMSAVWQEAPYRGGPLLVLLALADWANDEGWCWPSIPAIGEKARLTERQVHNVLGQLVQDGVVVKESGGGRAKSDPKRPTLKLGNPTRYRVITANFGSLKSVSNPEIISGFDGVEIAGADPVQNPGNPETGFRVCDPPNPEICAAQTLKSDASLYGRTVIEPSGKANPSPAPSREREGRRSADGEGELRPHVDAVMLGCWLDVERRGPRRAIAAQLRQCADVGEPLATAQLGMIAAWRAYGEAKPLLRFPWGAAKFFGEGHWRDPDGWPYDERRLEEQRRAATARIGVAR